MYRAQATPAAGGPGSAWNIQVQDSTGAWLFRSEFTSVARDIDKPEDAAVTVPRFMQVGLSNLQLFACAGGRTSDNAENTTALIELKLTRAPSETRAELEYIQDLLNGDDRFVSNAPGPLIGPSSPPTPPVSGPGDPIRKGMVSCAMTQLDDRLNTPELHMLTIDKGVLYHSMASNFGPYSAGSGRFRTVSKWADVGEALGGGFGRIVSVAMVGQPAAINVFFFAETAGRFRLYHAVRYSGDVRQPDNVRVGSWRPTTEVLGCSGDAVNGFSAGYALSAGICPMWEPSASNATEILLALWGKNEVRVMRVVHTALQWKPGVNGIYSPLMRIDNNEFSPEFFIRQVDVTTRPFLDNPKPAP